MTDEKILEFLLTAAGPDDPITRLEFETLRGVNYQMFMVVSRIRDVQAIPPTWPVAAMGIPSAGAPAATPTGTADINDVEITVLEIKPREDVGNILAFVDLQVGEFVIRDFKVIRSKEGDGCWASLPQGFLKELDGTRTWYNLVELPEGLKKRALEAVKEAYEADIPY